MELHIHISRKKFQVIFLLTWICHSIHVWVVTRFKRWHLVCKYKMLRSIFLSHLIYLLNVFSSMNLFQNTYGQCGHGTVSHLYRSRLKERFGDPNQVYVKGECKTRVYVWLRYDKPPRNLQACTWFHSPSLRSCSRFSWPEKSNWTLILTVSVTAWPDLRGRWDRASSRSHVKNSPKTFSAKAQITKSCVLV